MKKTKKKQRPRTSRVSGMLEALEKKSLKIEGVGKVSISTESPAG